MHLILRADKDAYITNRVISEQRVTGSNTGEAGTLDLFKLYGITSSGSTPNVELSRLLIHFDTTILESLISRGKINLNSSTLRCFLKLKDVYGGQPTPSDFNVTCYPLSFSFAEGIGRDIVQFTDKDVCNFISASRSSSWVGEGCVSGGYSGQICDYLTASGVTQFTSSMYFQTGFEDLSLDVTDAIKAMMTGSIANEGFRIAFSPVEENDNLSYFVKRFGTRKSYDVSKRPELIITEDDTIYDDTGLASLDTDLTFVLYNYEKGNPAFLTSGSTSTIVSGSNCLVLKLVTEVSGGWFEFIATGSQYGTKIGIYSASFNVPSTNSNVLQKLNLSGTFKAKPIWGSLDGTVAFKTGSYLTFNRKEAFTTFATTSKYDVSVEGISDLLEENSEVLLRVNLFDRLVTGKKLVKLPSQSTGATVRDTHVSIRDLDTGETVIPFDTTTYSSRCSSDASGMWYMLYTYGWNVGHRYVVDVMTSTNGVEKVYHNAGPIFKIITSR